MRPIKSALMGVFLLKVGKMRKYKITVLLAVILCIFLTGCAQKQSINEPEQISPAERDRLLLSKSSQDQPKRQLLPSLTDSSQLSDYLTYAALSNPGLEASFNQFKAALEQVPQSKALPDPRFTYRYFIEEVETRVGPQQQSYQLAQMFPWFGKLDLRGDIAAQAANSAQQKYEAEKLRLFYDVKDAYYEYYYLAKAVEIAEENVRLMQHLESVARTRYKTAIGTHPDVIRSQVELGKLQDQFEALLDMRQPVMAQLNAVLNRPVNTEIPWPEKIQLQKVDFTDEQILAQLVEKNPELKSLSFDIDRKKHGIELAKKDFFPDITLGVSLIDTENSTVSSPRDNGKDPIVTMVSINVPIWWEKYEAALRQAKANYSSAIQQRQQKINSLSSMMKMTLYRFKDAQRKIDLYRDILLPKATESFKATEAGFRAGSVNFSDLVDSQRVLLQFQLAYERARVDYAQNLAKIEMLIGQQIPAI